MIFFLNDRWFQANFVWQKAEGESELETKIIYCIYQEIQQEFRLGSKWNV